MSKQKVIACCTVFAFASLPAPCPAQSEAGRTASSQIGRVGQRQESNPRLSATARLQSRIASRVQNRIRNRLDRTYHREGDDLAVYQEAADQVRAVQTRPTP
jgi:hypothetical protein